MPMGEPNPLPLSALRRGVRRLDAALTNDPLKTLFRSQ